MAIVDERNQITGSVTRREMRERKLLHRATYVFVFDSDNRLYVQHRTMTKDVYPGYYDLAAGGVVLTGEAYGESAVRELEEELGVSGVALAPWFEFFHEDEYCRVFGFAFGCRYDGPLKLQPEEVQSVDRMDVDEVLGGRSDRRFAPDSLHALRLRFEPG